MVCRSGSKRRDVRRSRPLRPKIVLESRPRAILPDQRPCAPLRGRQRALPVHRTARAGLAVRGAGRRARSPPGARAPLPNRRAAGPAPDGCARRSPLPRADRPCTPPTPARRSAPDSASPAPRPTLPRSAGWWPASTCAVWSSPPTPCTPSERPGRRSSPPAGTTSWSSRATRRSCAGNCRARPGGRCRCWTAPAPPGTDVARFGG